MAPNPCVPWVSSARQSLESLLARETVLLEETAAWLRHFNLASQFVDLTCGQKRRLRS